MAIKIRLSELKEVLERTTHNEYLGVDDKKKFESDLIRIGFNSRNAAALRNRIELFELPYEIVTDKVFDSAKGIQHRTVKIIKIKGDN